MHTRLTGRKVRGSAIALGLVALLPASTAAQAGPDDEHLLRAHHEVHGDTEKIVDLSKQAARELEELLKDDEAEVEARAG